MNIFKKLFLLGLAGVFSLAGRAQSMTINNVQDVVRQSNYRQNSVEADGEMVDLSDIDGSPYWHPDFEPGKIRVDGKNGKTTLNVFMRYRVFDDIFEVKKSKSQPDSKITNLKRSKALGIELANNKFVFLKHLPVEIRGVRNGYAQVLVPSSEDSGKAALYKRMSQTYRAGRKSKTPYGRDKKATLDEKDYYFAEIDGRLYHIKAHKRRAAKGFPDHKKDLKKYISKNNFKFRGDHRDQQMVRLVHYYNSL